MRPRDGLARGLCALPARPRLASGRLPGCWPQRLAWRGAELAVLFRGGLPPFPRRARLRARPPSPRRSHPCGVRPRAEIIAGDGGRALVPRACGAVGCARGARPCIPAVSAVCLPASGRARSACRAVCAVRALRRASPPSSGGQVRALKGFPILQREHRGTGTRLPALRSPPWAAIKPETMQKSPRSDQKRGDREIPNSQTASRTAENGLWCAALGAVWVYCAITDRMIEIPPPAVGANVFKLPLAAHATQIIRPVRRALVRKYHQGKPVHARNGRSCAPLTCAHCHPSHPLRA